MLNFVNGRITVMSLPAATVRGVMLKYPVSTELPVVNVYVELLYEYPEGIVTTHDKLVLMSAAYEAIVGAPTPSVYRVAIWLVLSAPW
jgi:hypothetical protein